MSKEPPSHAGSLPWARFAGEFVVIVLGVLVALAADSWNDGRLERGEEREYLARLHTSIARDTANYRSILNWMDLKEAGLGRLDALLSQPSLSFDPDQVRADLTAAPNYGWNVGPLAATATFEDLRSSGKLGLIDDTDLRNSIIQYYEEAEGEDRRMTARRTAYPLLSYELVPFRRAGDDMDEYATVDDVEGLLDRLRESELPRHVLAETNRTHFIRGSITRMHQSAVQLLSAIENELIR